MESGNGGGGAGEARKGLADSGAVSGGRGPGGRGEPRFCLGFLVSGTPSPRVAQTRAASPWVGTSKVGESRGVVRPNLRCAWGLRICRLRASLSPRTALIWSCC